MPKLTKTTVDAIKPAAADTWVWDSEVPGFGVRCTPAGRKTYVARWRNADGKQRKMALARCCDMPVDKARDLARKTFSQVAEGADPMEQRRPTPAPSAAPATTVEAMFQAFADSRKAKGRASADEVERALLKAENNAADALGRTKAASAVTPADITAYVAGIFKAGHRGAADKHRSYIHSAYEWAIKSTNDYTDDHRRDWGITTNPAAAVPRDAGAVGTRDRNLDAAELKALWGAMRPGNNRFAPETAACVRVLVACGQRVQETLRLEAHEIDLQERLWRMPAHKTKLGKYPHDIPLPEAIIPDLKLMLALHPQGYVFAGRDGGLMPHQSIGQALARWNDSEIAHFTPRDLRRTWKSRAHDAGIDRFTRDLIQQHAKSDTGSKNYDRAVYLPQMREAMKKWGAWIADNLEDKPALTLVA